MKILTIFLVLTVIYAKEMVVSPEYTEYLKSVATWEVVDYEDNIFKDWTFDEFMTLLGDNKPEFFDDSEAVPVEIKKNLPTSLDWAGSICEHKVLDQGMCGSCWAFAAAGVVSDRCCIQATKDYGWLSPQELVSCNTQNQNCNGGFARIAFNYVRSNGLVDMKCMPYVGNNTACNKKCEDKSDWVNAHKCKCRTIVDCSEKEGIKSCFNDGPVAARMVVYRDFLCYRSGVYCKTPNSTLIGAHAIRCIGYKGGEEEAIHCINSWSKVWGDKGYFWIKPTDECGFFIGPNNIYSVKDC